MQLLCISAVELAAASEAAPELRCSWWTVSNLLPTRQLKVPVSCKLILTLASEHRPNGLTLLTWAEKHHASGVGHSPSVRQPVQWAGSYAPQNPAGRGVRETKAVSDPDRFSPAAAEAAQTAPAAAAAGQTLFRCRSVLDPHRSGPLVVQVGSRARSACRSMNSTHLPNGPLADEGPGFPAQTAADRQGDSKQWTLEVAGRSTEFLATPYSDRIMLVASNTGTFGTIMQARCASHS